MDGFVGVAASEASTFFHELQLLLCDLMELQKNLKDRQVVLLASVCTACDEPMEGMRSANIV